MLYNTSFLRLSLRMCTVSSNQVVKTRSIFYTLPVNAAQELHSADYIPSAARLACVIADQNGTIQWDTFGLSDFLRSSKKLNVLNLIGYINFS